MERLFTEASDLALDEVQRLQYVDFHTTLARQSAHEGRQALDGTQPGGASAIARSPPGRVRARAPAACKGRHAPEQGAVAADAAHRSAARNTDRPKRGFEIPVDAWFRDHSTSALRHRMVSGALVNVLGLSAPGIAKVIDRTSCGRRPRPQALLAGDARALGQIGTAEACAARPLRQPVLPAGQRTGREPPRPAAAPDRARRGAPSGATAPGSAGAALRRDGSAHPLRARLPCLRRRLSSLELALFGPT